MGDSLGEKIGDGMFKFAKYLPLFAGGLVGLVCPPGPGYSSVLERAMSGDWVDTGRVLGASYAGIGGTGDFEPKRAVGVKGLVIGGFVYKLIDALVDR
jgi:hypothetical protein